MRRIVFSLLLAGVFPCSAYAQDITSTPICFSIRNEAPYKVYGDVSTDYYTRPDGTKTRHVGTFRLEKEGSESEDGQTLTDRTRVCSQGPFYPGKQLEITIRTLLPIFSCKTSVELGEIVIKGEIKDDGSSRTWAVCY